MSASLDNCYFDPSYLFSVVGGDQETLKAIINAFINSGSILVLELQKAIQKKDYETVKRQVHSMKGMASTIGVSRIVTLAVSMEKCSMDEVGLLEIERLFAQMQFEFNQARHQLSLFL